MICPKCKSSIPELKLVCPTCVEIKSREAFLEYQLQFMEQVEAGQTSLAMATVQVQQHIQLYGDKRHAYCGMELAGGGKRSTMLYEKLFQLEHFCTQCDRVLHELIAKAKARDVVPAN